MLLWLIWITCAAVSLAGLVIIVRAISPTHGPGRDPRLMNMLMGDSAKYDRLVEFHGSPEKARAAWLRDNR